ncbi:MAG: glycosyltransferase [Novosphingobium sp.]|nr:glycosyltransferase [Novosphingobium sp.]
MTTPALTIAMSVYNNGPYVGEAIDSILTQTFDDFEFLIVNDGSTDGSGDVIDARAADDSRIRVIHQENRGFVASLNRLFAEARCDWIARMDGDDISLPQRLERQVAFIRANPGYAVVGCDAYLIGPDGKRLKKEGGEKPPTHEGIFANLEGGPLINHNAAMIARQPVLELGGYRPAYRHCEDYDLWLRLIDVARFANLPEELIAYRVYPGQVSNKHLVEQARNAAIAWQARLERLDGRADPTEGLDELPTLDRVDSVFRRDGVATYVRDRVVERMLYSPEALGGDGYDLLLDHIADQGTESRYWRAAARLLKHGRPAKAAGVAGALLRAG